MIDWKLYEPGSTENHPFYIGKTRYDEWMVTIEDDGSLDIDDGDGHTVRIPQSVLQALLDAYARCTAGKTFANYDDHIRP